MSTLTTFLLARIAEDEEAARAASTLPEGVERLVHVGGSRYRAAGDAPDREPVPLGGWSVTGGPDRLSDADMALMQKVWPDFIPNHSRPYYVAADGAWDDSEPTGASCFRATIPADGKAVAAHIARHDPARVLAECEARRRIVLECSDRIHAAEHDDDSMAAQWVAQFARETLWSLAFPYSDHPDMREGEWRP